MANTRPSYLALLRLRDPRALLIGQSVSRLGDGVSNVALVLLILERWRGATHLSLYGATGTVALVCFLLLGGVVVDRVSRRTLLLLSDLVRAAVIGVVALLAATNHLEFWTLLVMAFLFGSFDAVFMPAATALMPELVPEAHLPAANAASALSRSFFGAMLGPALGGLLAAWSLAGALAFDALTFLVSAGALLTMRPTPRPTTTETHVSMLQDVREGLRFTFRTPWLIWPLVVAGLTNAVLFGPQGTLMPLFLRHDLHASKQLVGLSFTIGGLGWLTGSAVVGGLRTPRHRMRVLTLSWFVASLVCGGIYFIHNVVLALAIPLLLGPLLSYGNVMWESLLQGEIPKELLGRISSVDWFVSLALAPIGLIVAGLVSTHVGIRAYFGLATLVTLPFSVMLLLSRRVASVDAGRVAAS